MAASATVPLPIFRLTCAGDLQKIAIDKSNTCLSLITPRPYIMGGLVAKAAFLEGKFGAQGALWPKDWLLVYDCEDGAGLALEAIYLGFTALLYTGSDPSGLRAIIHKQNPSAKVFERLAVD